MNSFLCILRTLTASGCSSTCAPVWNFFRTPRLLSTDEVNKLRIMHPEFVEFLKDKNLSNIRVVQAPGPPSKRIERSVRRKLGMKEQEPSS